MPGAEEYARLRAAGVCTRCYVAPAVPGRTRCRACAVQQNAGMRALPPEAKARNAASARARYRALTEAQRVAYRARKNDRRRTDRRRALAAYGGVCACCGEAAPAFLTIDHIGGGGNAHRRALSGGGRTSFRIYAWLRRQGYPTGYRVLCWNCNLARGVYGGCPHEDGRETVRPLCAGEASGAGTEGGGERHRQD